MRMNHITTVALAIGLSTGAMAGDICGLSNGKAATGTPIQLGAVVGKTGPEDFSSAARSAAAYFSCVNANGGINGRPIAYTVQDDTWNPEVAAQAATKLVKDTQVVGLVGSTSFVDCSVNAATYEKEGVAVIAGVGVPRACFHSPNISATNQGPRLSTVGAAQYLHEQLKVKSITCVAPGIPGFGDWVCAGVKDWGAQNGVQVSQVLFDPGQLDGNQIMLQVASNNPEGVVLGMPMGMMFPILTAAEQLDMGANMKWGLPTSAYHKDFPKAAGPYWDGKLYVHAELESLNKKGPDTDNWRAIMDKYGDAKDPRDSFSQAGFLAAKVATQALLSIKGEVNRASAFKAMKGIVNHKSDIVCAPWYFGPGARHQGNSTGRVNLMKKGGYEIVTECMRAKDPELADVLAAEAKGGLVN